MKSLLFFVSFLMSQLIIYSQVVPNASTVPSNGKITIQLPKDLKNADTTIKVKHFKKVSAYTTMFLGEYKNIDSLNLSERESAYKAIKNKYGIKSLQGTDYVSAFILLESKNNVTDITNLGVKVIGEPRSLVTVLIPVKLLELLLELPYVRLIEIGTPAYKSDIISRTQSRADSVIKGIALPQGYNGKGIVVGIIDEGFDFTHPNFFDSTGTKYRIKKVWNQNDNDTTGVPPNGYFFGSEYSTSTQILSKKTDNQFDTHGSHTTGLVAGSGYGNTGLYKGISSEADIVLVNYLGTKGLNIDVLLANIYIATYAQSVNKACVINMSLGNQNGPHDGASLFDNYIDTLINFGNQKGLITVGSAGNAANANIHCNPILKNNDSTKFVFLKPYKYKSYWPVTEGSKYIETLVYGALSKNLKVAFGIYNIKTGIWENISNIYDLNIMSGQSLPITFFNSSITIPIKFTVGPDIITKKPNASIIINDTSYQTLYNLDSNKLFTIAFLSSDNNVHAWVVTPRSNGGDNPQFVSNLTGNFNSNNVIDGDNNITISEIGGTGKNIISVGAFNSFGISDTIGKKASFSSLGNTVDGRIKPDVSASGFYVLSSFNSWEDSITLTKNNLVYSYNTKFNGRNYPYGLDAGTSMAAPVVTGIIGLWLQACPLLTSNQAKYIIQQTAIRDNFTGITPNNFYGFGKINAYGGIKLLLSLIPPKPLLTPNPIDTLICKKDTFTLTAPSGYSSYIWFRGTSIIATTSIPTYKIRSSGSFYCAVKNSNGWWSNYSDTINVRFDTIPAFPVITINSTQNTCNSSQTYLLTSTTGYSYQWYKNDTVIVNATAQTYSPFVSGIYRVRTFSKNNACSFLSDSVIIANLISNSNRLFNNDTIKICGADSINIAPITNYNSYLWSTGSTNNTTTAKSTGLYKLTAYCGTNSSNYMYEQFSSSNNATKYITIPDASQLHFTNAMSILLKTRIEGSIPYSPVLFQNGINTGYKLTLDPASTVITFWYPNIDNTIGLKYTMTALQVQNADWFYIGIIKRSDSSFFYVNGNLVDKAKTANPIPVTNNNTTFGASNDGYTGRYSGSMDDISFWNKALSPSEVSRYSSCLTGSETGCVGYYNFEGSNAMQDHSIYNNTALQYGSTNNYPNNQITTCSPTQIKDSVFVSIINPSVTPNNPTICINKPIQINSKIQTNAVKRVWSTGDTTTNIIVKPKTNTTYTVAISDNYQICSDSTTVNVSAPLVGINLIGNVSICQGDSSTLYAPASNTAFQWLKNNIAISGAINNTFTVKNSGTYRVICFNGFGCSDTSAAIIITVNQVTPASISPNGNTAFCQGDSIQLTASQGKFYQWLQNSNSINFYNQTFTANSSGLYAVIVVDSNGCSSTSPTVNIKVNPLPSGTIQTPLQSFICDGSSVVLKSTAINKCKYQWFNTSTAINGAIDSNYTAFASGSYSVNYVDSNGCKSASTNTINLSLYKKPKANFNFTPRCVNVPIVFTNLSDTSSSGNVQWSWNFGGNNTSSLVNPVVSFSNAGTYLVQLKVIPQNCPLVFDTISVQVVIEQVPQGINYPPIDAKKQVVVNLQARNIGQSYYWIPSTGLSNSNIENPTATLSQEQLYQILITTDAGCIVADTQKVRVFSDYGIFVPTGFSPDGDGVNDILRPLLVGIKELHYFKVMNRWGQLLFETNKMNDGWNGIYNSKLQLTDTYIWLVEAVDLDGRVIQQSGKSTLIR